MKKILSISIAAYNQEKYLDRCIQSLLIPSLEKIEVIIVNDGSKDKTSEIAHKYADKYPESIIVIDKANGHYGSCANASLKNATGKYYKLLDADDYFDSNEFEQYVKALEDSNADMVITTHVICNQTPIEISPKNVMISKVYPQSEIDFTALGMTSCLGMHGVTYKMDILRKVNLTLTEKCCATDAEYCYYPIASCKTVQFFDFKLYMYQTNIEGQDTTIVSESQKEQKYIVAKRMLDDYIKNKSENKNIRHNQRLVLERSLIGYYGIYILHFKKNKTDDLRIKEMDNMLLKADAESYYNLNSVQTFKIKFIKLYRALGVTFSRITPILSKLKK